MAKCDRSFLIPNDTSGARAVFPFGTSLGPFRYASERCFGRKSKNIVKCVGSLCGVDMYKPTQERSTVENKYGGFEQCLAYAVEK